MPADAPRSAGPDPDLKGRREDIHQSVFRAARGLAIIMAAVLALAAAAVILGARAVRQEQRAEAAELAVREQLCNSYLAQARATRLTGRMGRRTDALVAISNAVAIRPSLELRNEALASFALLDVADRGVSLPPTEPSIADFDRALTRYAFADKDRKIHVRSLANQQELFTLNAGAVVPPAGGAVQNIFLSPDGRYLAARFRGGAVVVWSVGDQQVRVRAGLGATNRLLGTLLFDTEAGQATFANADRDGEISTFDLATGKELWHVPIKVAARYFRFKPGDRNVLALATDQQVELLRADTGESLAVFPHSTRVGFFLWAEEGRRLFVACQSGEVYDWNVPRQSFRVLSGHGEACLSLLPLPERGMLLTGSRDGTSRFWDLNTGRSVLEMPRGIAQQLETDGARVAYWQPGVGYGVWEMRPGAGFEDHPTDPTQGALLTFDLSRDGRWAVGTQNKGFHFWNLRSGFNEFVPVTDLFSVRFATDSQALLVGRESGLELWPFALASAAGNQPAQLRFGDVKKLAAPGAKGVHAFTATPGGRTLAVEAGDYVMSVVDVAGERPPVVLKEKLAGRWTRGPASATGAGRFALSPEGRWLAQGMGFGPHPVVWSAVTGQRLAELDCDTGNVSFSADGRQLLVATTKAFYLYAVGDWKRVRQLPRDEPSSTFGVAAISGDSKWAAITPTRQIVRLVDLRSGETLADLQSPDRQAINSLRWSADGDTLVAAMANDSLHVWDLKSLRGQLAALNLDWAQDATNATEVALSTARPRSWLSPLVIGLAFVAVATVASMLLLRRHRAIVREYLATEALSRQRSRELELATVELAHSQKMRALGTLAAGIAHDFNNLLSVIRMSNKLIARETVGNAEVQDNVADIEQAVLQGKHVVGSMLGYAREPTDDGQSADLDEVVEETVSLLSKEFLSGLALTMELDRHTPPVKIGRGRLEQALLNLLVNASEAMQGQGKLKIVVRPRAACPEVLLVLRPHAAGSYVELSVTDSGPGIALEIRDRIFEPFFTTKRTGTKAGTGLGLSLVYSIAQQEGLGLKVESEPGEGATFSLFIPTAPEKSGTVRETHSSQTQTPP
ncbi:MAG: hypothetical protein EXS35_11880 [Pedosphaera sp.]|nr:hypothetical protein [Pedosphaera sp.]